MANEQRQDRDLILPPNTFAFVLDTTKGRVSVSVGPFKSSLSTTDQLVGWNADRKRFMPVEATADATQVFPMAAEGQYIVLSNPSNSATRYPQKGTSSDAMELEVGRKVNISGPITFPLWPGQTARTIDGHHLRHNQYLIVRVYDEEQARNNWRSAVMKPQVTKPPQQIIENPQTAETQQIDGQADSTKDAAATVEEAPTQLTIGQLMLVRGTEVSFFIPPTGIEVVPEQGDRDKFVREAVTLERLEYSILLDESGEKRYVRGPAVVFPGPTEKFVQSEAGDRKFRAIELNEQSGLYIKVIADYDEGDVRYKVGDELFITGREQAIYFPRHEHSIIQYDDKKKHHAIAVPAGEGRYVLDRNKGTVDLIKGPKMFLPDPRTQVIVLRILDAHTVDLLYPGNKEAQAINAQYLEKSARQTAGEHLLSGESERSVKVLGSDSSKRGAAEEFRGETFGRGSAYTPPRTVTLNTKYEGAVGINIWSGYAVLVTKKTGERRVEVGPKMILLEYDETLMPLELSTGRPKTDQKLLRTAYLRVQNNQVGDLVLVETKDLVKVLVEVSYRVNFDGTSAEEQQKWFSVENYVKVLTDHARSRMRNAAKRYGIQEFYTGAIDLLRDAVLGETPKEGGKRKGLSFTENGMHVYDLEVLGVSIEDRNVGQLLVEAQSSALRGAITISQAQQESERTKQLESLKRLGIDEREATNEKEGEVARNAIERRLVQLVAQVKSDLVARSERQKVIDLELASDKAAREQEITLAKMSDEQELARLEAETKQFADRMKAFSPELSNSLQMFGDKVFIEKLVSAIGPAALAAGTTTADLFAQIFKGTPYEGVMQSLAARPFAVVESKRSGS